MASFFWTGYTNRLTPIVGDGFNVATSIYRSMMQYLAEDDHPGDWTMPEGLYRSGDYIFKNGARNNWITQNSSNTYYRNFKRNNRKPNLCH